MKDEALSIFLYLHSLMTRWKLLFSLFGTGVMLLVIVVNSQYFNMKTVSSGSKLKFVKFESQLVRSKLPIKIPTLRDNIAKMRANEQLDSL